jgi:hypothetical protein
MLTPGALAGFGRSQPSEAQNILRSKLSDEGCEPNTGEAIVTATKKSAQVLAGNRIVYQDECKQHQTVSAYLSDYSSAVSDYNIRVEDTSNHIGVEQTADKPISRLYLWSIRTTICPEAYIHLDVQAGKAMQWTLRYRLLAGTTGH